MSKVKAYQYLGHRKFGINGYRYKRPEWLIELFRQGKLFYDEDNCLFQPIGSSLRRFIPPSDYIVIENESVHVYNEFRFNDIYIRHYPKPGKLDKRRKMLEGDNRYGR